MRVVYLTAGAGGMYCGSCLRDNALAAAMIRRGHDVQLWPVYSPIRTDEADVSDSRVVFGGINVYLRHRFGARWRPPRFISKMLDHPSLLRWAMRGAGSTDPKLAAALMTTLLQAEAGPHAPDVDALTEMLSTAKADIVHLPNAFFVGLARQIRRRLNIPVVCTLTGEDILIDKLEGGARDGVLSLMRGRVADVDGFLSVTDHYSGYATRYFGIESHRIRKIPLAIATEDHGPSPNRPAVPFTIGYLARICPEKGLHHLIDAFELLVRDGRDVRLDVAGYLGRRDQAYFEALRRRVAREPMAPRVRFHGEVDRAGKLAFLRNIDVLSVPTVYQEAKGLYVLEAMAHGVPVVQPSHGSFPELIESTGGGILHAPNDAKSLADGLKTLMDDATMRSALGAAARQAVREKHHVDQAADAAWAYFEQLCNDRFHFPGRDPTGAVRVEEAGNAG